MMRKLFRFSGGVKPETRKAESTTLPIERLPLPPRLVVPLHQSIGGTPRPLVKAGQKVLKGERIGAADGNISAAIFLAIQRSLGPCNRFRLFGGNHNGGGGRGGGG